MKHSFLVRVDDDTLTQIKREFSTSATDVPSVDDTTAIVYALEKNLGYCDIVVVKIGSVEGE